MGITAIAGILGTGAGGLLGELIPEALEIGSKALVACSMLVGIRSGILVIFI